MRLCMLPVVVMLLSIGRIAAQNDGAPFFRYEGTRTSIYFAEKLEPSAPRGASARRLAELMKAQVLELAQRDWGPWQLVSHPVNQGGNRFTYFNCPDELLVALAAAYPLLDGEGKVAAREAADREFTRYPPLTHPFKPLEGELRGWHDVPESARESATWGGTPWLSAEQKAVAAFKTLYAIWAYADAFDRWETITRMWPDILAVKQRLASEWDFKPRWAEKIPTWSTESSGGYTQGGPGILTEQIARSPRYRHELLRYLLVSTHGFYGNPWPRDEAEINVFKQFAYTKLLSGLIGYGRIAEKMGQPHELAWAKERFDFVASQALTHSTAPCYWSSPWLTPEVGRMLRDHAGEYLDELKRLPNVFAGTDRDGFPNEGPWYRVIDPHHWYLAHAGSNGAAPPCSPMSGFLAQAYLFRAPAERLDDWTDIPWCQADYWYIQKCAVAINAYNSTGWTRPDSQKEHRALPETAGSAPAPRPPVQLP